LTQRRGVPSFDDMFEITDNDIAGLSDEDLRTLVGRLCEAELRRHGHPVAAVTYGGDQTAKDGGLDVRVALPAGAETTGFIPRPATGYQAKKSDMPRAAILKEMMPDGTLRSVIAELAAASGAYIIVSANGSTSDTALTSRRKAMADAVKDCPAAEKLWLDFYDRTRIATWVREHAGVILWVRARIGKSVPGWHPYGSWSHAPAGADPAYLADDTARITIGGSEEGGSLSATDGINRMREVLGRPGSVIRLVGLSGVGKTRLVEALFDPAVGTGSLDPSQAIYTNVPDTPDPQPAGLASDLVLTGTRAILVIDNCPSDLHRRLSEIARSAGSLISVITVEYDIRDDQPEGTDVFTLDSSSLPLIESLIARRYPGISRIDAGTIAASSGGNARVALAIAATVGRNESLAGLSDADLFMRLFQQRQEPDAGLLAMAEACSLVYSFDGEKTTGDEAELPVLGSLIGRSADEVFGGVAELKRRELVQERGPFRAVLPHAIANRLAARGLQNIAPATLNARLVQKAPERLLQSFSHRLGYLDGSQQAKAIASSWLEPGGLLSDLPSLSEAGRAMFLNIAPAVPDAVLAAMETALKGGDAATFRNCKYFVRVLRSLAYEAQYFERALALMLQFAQQPRGEGLGEDEAHNAVVSLFSIVLSGTHAPVEMRLKAVEAMLRSADGRVQAIGVEALETMLKSDHFSSGYNFAFGARSRDYGYEPRTGKEIQDWFGTVLKLAEEFAVSDSPVAAAVQKAIANEFRALWSNSGQSDALDRIARAIAAKNFWRDGWLAARSARIFDGKDLPPALLAQLVALEEVLRPKDLVNKVRGLVIGTGGGHLELDEPEDLDDQDFEGAAGRAAAAVAAVAGDVAADEAAFKAVLPELKGSSGMLGPFGEGLARNANDPRAAWDAITGQFASGNELSLAFTGGFLRGLHQRDAALANTILDEAVDHPALASIYPVLQANVAVDEAGLARLHRALGLGKAPINSYYGLAWGRAGDAVPGPAFKELVLAIDREPGGLPVALEIVSMRLVADAGDKRATAPEVREAGRALLSRYTFRKKDPRTGREDYETSLVIKASLAGPEGVPIVEHLCRGLMAGAATYAVHPHDYDDLIKALFEVHPLPMLDQLFSGDEDSRTKSVRLLQDLARFQSQALAAVPDDLILEWCHRDPAIRYPIAAAVMTLFQPSQDREPRAWTELPRKLLERAPDPRAVLNQIARRLRPTSWSGSLASILESRLKLLADLPVGGAPELRAALEEAKDGLRRQIDAERRYENADDRARNARFE
jgi:hypothetical protein